MFITKSQFVAGAQCLKRLYLIVHEPELAAQPDDLAEAIIEQGREVGLLAKLEGRQIGRARLDVDREQVVRDRRSGMSLTHVAKKSTAPRGRACAA